MTQQLVARRATEIAADAAHLAEVKADELAVLSGDCPESDPPDATERRRRDLDR